MRRLSSPAAGLVAGLAAFTASLPAQADGLYIQFGGQFDGGGNGLGVYAVDNGWQAPPRNRDDWEPRRGYSDYRTREERRRQARRERDRCSPRDALRRAERLGLRRVEIRDVDRRTIRVSGRRYGERIVVTFGRQPSCPVVRL